LLFAVVTAAIVWIVFVALTRRSASRLGDEQRERGA
jgi:hypothetical protein